jgi:hypothetical protein
MPKKQPEINENKPEEPIEEKPEKKRRGQSREFLKEISQKGVEAKKKYNTVKVYEREKKKKEIEDKFNMIQEELARQKAKENEPQPPPEPSQPIQETQQETKQKRPPPKSKKIVEVIEEVEDETDDEGDDEGEVIIKRIIKKKPIKKAEPKIDDRYNFIKQTNLEILKNKYDDDMKRRIALSLFDY